MKTFILRLVIKRKGVEYVLKTCPSCGDEWYAKRKQNRCTLCGGGLVRRTPENIDKNWDELPGGWFGEAKQA